MNQNRRIVDIAQSLVTAAGLLEPWTREGISSALRSGLAAGAAVADGDPTGYEAFISSELEPEQRAGARLLRLFERVPGAAHLAVTRTGAGAGRFVRFSRGETSLRLLHR